MLHANDDFNVELQHEGPFDLGYHVWYARSGGDSIVAASMHNNAPHQHFVHASHLREAMVDPGVVVDSTRSLIWAPHMDRQTA
jgi:hypothetical protein